MAMSLALLPKNTPGGSGGGGKHILEVFQIVVGFPSWKKKKICAKPKQAQTDRSACVTLTLILSRQGRGELCRDCHAFGSQ